MSHNQKMILVRLALVLLGVALAIALIRLGWYF